MNPKMSGSGANRKPVFEPTNPQLTSVLNQQNFGWMNGDRPPIEQWIGSKESGDEFKDRLLCLISNEAALRRKLGESPSLEEYQKRFPLVAESIAIQWEVDRFLSSRPQWDEETPTDNARPRTGIPDLQSIGDRYIVQSELGDGGMGIVLRALDKKLDRTVAIKLLKNAFRANADQRARFQIEAEAVAKITHPNVVQLYDIGETDGQPYIAMEYCGGGTLATLLRESTIDTRRIANWIRAIAQGVETAHRLGIVHRDLKPSNILFAHADSKANPVETEDIEKLNNLIPKVSDFGLAKRIDIEDRQTLTGEIIGTPAFLAPEQLGKVDDRMAPRVDIYALGAILYESLTGRPPIRGATTAETLRLLREQDPVRIRQLQPLIPKDLETITHKCLDRDPLRRYTSAKEVADDLQRFLEGHPIQAKPISVAVRIGKWTKRNPGLAASLATASVALGSLLIFGFIFTSRLNVARNDALAAKEDAIEQSRRAEQNSQWAMEAVDEFITKVGEKELSSLPGADKLRKSLLESAVNYCKRFNEFEANRNPEARNEVALSHRRLAKIHKLLSENDSWLSELELAAKIHRGLVEEFPDNEAYLYELGKTLNNYANAQATMVSADVALTTTEEAIRIKERLIQRNPSSKEYRSSLVVSLTSIGTKYRIDAPEKAEASYRRAESLLLNLIEEDPDKWEYRQSALTLYTNLASVLIAMGRAKEGEEVAERSFRLIDPDPAKANSPEKLLSLSGTWSILGAVRLVQLDRGRSLEAYAKEYSVLKQLINEFPERVGYQQTFCMNRYNVASLLRDLGRYPECEEVLSECADILDKHSSTPGFQSAISKLQTAKLLLFTESCRMEEAISFAKSLEPLFAKTIESDRAHPDSVCEACSYLLSYGMSYRYLKQDDLAHPILEKAWERIRKQVHAQPEHADAKRLLSELSSSLIIMDLDRGEVDAASRRIDAYEQTIPKNKGTANLFRGLLLSHAGKPRDALAIVREGLPEREGGNLRPDRVAAFIAAKCSQNVLLSPDVPEAERKGLSDEYAAIAVEELKKGAFEGYFTSLFARSWLHRSPVFDAIRGREDYSEFWELFSEMQPVP